MSIADLFTPQTFSDFCDVIAGGFTLSRACDVFGLAASSVNKYMRSYASEEQQREYMIAMQQRAHAYAEQAMEIANGNDVAGLSQDGEVTVDADAMRRLATPAARKMRIELRKWYAERVMPSVYGTTAKVEARQVDKAGNDMPNVTIDEDLLRTYAPSVLRPAARGPGSSDNGA